MRAGCIPSHCAHVHDNDHDVCSYPGKGARSSRVPGARRRPSAGRERLEQDANVSRRPAGRCGAAGIWGALALPAGMDVTHAPLCLQPSQRRGVHARVLCLQLSRHTYLRRAGKQRPGASEPRRRPRAPQSRQGQSSPRVSPMALSGTKGPLFLRLSLYCRLHGGRDVSASSHQ